MPQKPKPERKENGEETERFKNLTRHLLKVDKGELSEQERRWQQHRSLEVDKNSEQTIDQE